MRSKKHWRVALRGFACNNSPPRVQIERIIELRWNRKGVHFAIPREIFLILLGNIVYGKTLDYSN